MKLSNNELSDISILKLVEFPKLKSLILSNNYIKNIDALGEADFPILLELKLSNNKISDISKLKLGKFAKIIKRLYLSHNNIKDIEPLICSTCYSRSKDSFLSMTMARHSCIFNELNELKLAGNLNYTEQINNEDKIDYLKTHVKFFII